MSTCARIHTHKAGFELAGGAEETGPGHVPLPRTAVLGLVLVDGEASWCGPGLPLLTALTDAQRWAGSTHLLDSVAGPDLLGAK